MKLLLPNISADIDNVSGKTLVLALGGRAPSKEWFSALDVSGGLWAIDSGVEICRALGKVPERLVGDRDSASCGSWQWAIDNGASVSKFDAEKDLTDFQLALDIACEEREGANIFLTGVFGGRFDHLWSAMVSFLHRSDEYTPIGAADDSEGILFLRGEGHAALTFEKKPEALSLIPFSRECWGVTINGAHWPLDDVVIEYRDPYSISNTPSDANSPVTIKLDTGLLGIYWSWKESA